MLRQDFSLNYSLEPRAYGAAYGETNSAFYTTRVHVYQYGVNSSTLIIHAVPFWSNQKLPQLHQNILAPCLR